MGIYYKVSTDLAATWPDAGFTVHDHTDDRYDDALPCAGLQADGSVFVAWENNEGYQGNPAGFFRVLYRTVNEQGPIRTTTALAVDAQQYHQQAPRVAVGPGDSVNVVWEDSRNHYTPDHLYQIFARSGIWKTKPTGHWEWEANYDWISEPANNPPAYNDLNPDIAFLSCSGSRVVVWDGEYNYPSDQSRQIWYHKRSADATPPGAPGGLQVSAPGAFVYLYWTPLPVDAKGYNVYRTDGVMPPLPPFQKINAQPVIPAFYYDSTADFGKCYTYKVTALDCAENEGASSNYAGYYGCSTGDQLASVDVGNPAPSSNTVRRSGYYTWGGTPDSTVDYDPDSLVYRFTNLVPDSFYLLGVGYFENNPSRVREQSLHINGVVVHGRCLLPGWPAQMV